jgi:sec-independent protein translocase protein TatB
LFSSIGWGEILVVVIVGIIIIGPERLPRLITDVRAAVKAARDAIANAREELDQEFGDDLNDFRKPLSQLNDVRQMGAKGLITKTLLDGDDSFLTDLEASARSVSDAASGRGRSGTQEGAGDGDAGAAQAEPTGQSELTGPPEQDTTSEPDKTAETPERTHEERQEPRVELPQQQDAGTTRDWSSGADYDDAM